MSTVPVGNRWLILSVLFVTRTVMGFQFQSIASVSPLLKEDLALDLASLGTLIGAWMLPGVFLAIPGGFLGRRFGDKRVACFGLALMAVGSVMISGADGYTLAMGGRLLSGTGAALLNVLLAKMVADWFADREIATAMGILVVSWPLGIGLALILLGPLSADRSWSEAIQMTAWASVVALALMAAIYRRPNERPATKHIARESWRLNQRELVLVCLAGLIWTTYNAGYIIVVSFSPVLLTERGLTTAGAAVVASFATWPLIATIPLGGILADRTGRGQAIMLGCLVVVSLSMPLILEATSPLLVLAAIGALAGPPAGVIMALPGRVLSTESRHLGMGVYFTFYYIGMSSLPGVAGWLRDLTGVAVVPLLLGSGLVLFAAVCVVLFAKLHRQPSVVPQGG